MTSFFLLFYDSSGSLTAISRAVSSQFRLEKAATPSIVAGILMSRPLQFDAKAFYGIAKCDETSVNETGMHAFIY